MQSDSRRLDFFVDGKGNPIKFRIQPGFNSVLRSTLEDGITSNNGVIVTKMPIHGIVVIDPKSRAGRELIREWAWSERPARYFVSYVFVQRCIVEKRLLPVEGHSLTPDDVPIGGKVKIQLELSNDAQEKLALYIATIMPHPSSGNRSSNKVYQRLVKNRHLFPWVGVHDWKTFRNQYCKNKRFYDKLIKAIVRVRQEKALSVYALEECLVANKESSQQTVVDVAIPVRKKFVVTAKAAVLGNKKVRFNNSLIIERERKFADDVTNVERKIKVTKPNRTIDDMLRAPLPSIVDKRTKRLGRLPRKTVPTSIAQDKDIKDVEVGRAVTNKTPADVWVNETFRNDGWDASNTHVIDKTNIPQADADNKTYGSRTLDLYQYSLTSYGMDFDDFRSAAALAASTADDNGADTDEEQLVVKLLGLPTTGPSDSTTPNHSNDPVSKEGLTAPPNSAFMNTPHQASARLEAQDRGGAETIAIRELAQNTRFTSEEVQQKLAGFSGDMNKTRVFFLQCRELVDELFAQSADVGSTMSVSAWVPKRVKAKRAIQAAASSLDTTELSFPAGNTRARKAARAAAKDNENAS